MEPSNKHYIDPPKEQVTHSGIIKSEILLNESI